MEIDDVARRLRLLVSRFVELRALRRLCVAARAAVEEAAMLELDPCDNLKLQLEWGRIAAFPAGERVDASMQNALCAKIESRRLFALGEQGRMAPRPVFMTTTRAPTTVPLAEIPENLLREDRGGEVDSRSASGASSWTAPSSRSSSNFSSASHDSLSGLVQGFDCISEFQTLS